MVAWAGVTVCPISITASKTMLKSLRLNMDTSSGLLTRISHFTPSLHKGVPHTLKYQPYIVTISMQNKTGFVVESIQ